MKLIRSKVTPELENFVKEGFKKHTQGVLGFYDSEPYEAINAYSEEDDLMGTIIFRYFWGAIQCKYLFISDSYRQRGLGRELVQAMESLGRERSCRAVYLDTLSFQAVEFYKKQGYTLELIRNGYKHDIKRYYFKKDLY